MKQSPEVEGTVFHQIVDDVGKATHQTAAHSTIKNTVPQRISLNAYGSSLDCLDKAPTEIFAIKTIPARDTAQLRLELL